MFLQNKKKKRARALFEAALAQSRRPEFFGEDRLPDTFEARYESLMLHVALLDIRLLEEGREGAEFSRELDGVMFSDIDHALREIGVGDLSVARKVKKMASEHFGRMKAYRDALAGDDATLGDAVNRNFCSHQPAEDGFRDAVARYLRACAANLAAQPAQALMQEGAPHWAEAPR